MELMALATGCSASQPKAKHSAAGQQGCCWNESKTQAHQHQSTRPSPNWRYANPADAHNTPSHHYWKTACVLLPWSELEWVETGRGPRTELKHTPP
jgi:hypothetical protein